VRYFMQAIHSAFRLSQDPELQSVVSFTFTAGYYWWKRPFITLILPDKFHMFYEQFPLFVEILCNVAKPGTNLGLAHCKACCRRNRTRVIVTTFTIRHPCGATALELCLTFARGQRLSFVAV
jgi:hypothetical protein